MKKKAPRKPTVYRSKAIEVRISSIFDGEVGIICGDYINLQDCRKLAAWLTKAAAWLEYKERERKGE